MAQRRPWERHSFALPVDTLYQRDMLAHPMSLKRQYTPAR